MILIWLGHFDVNAYFSKKISAQHPVPLMTKPDIMSKSVIGVLRPNFNFYVGL